MKKPRLREVRVTNVPDQLNDDLLNISKNLGITISTLVKPKLYELTNSYDANMKLPNRGLIDL